MWLAFAQSTARFTLGNNNNNAGSAAKQDLLQYRQQTSSAACDHTRHEVPVVLHWLVPCARISWVMRHSKCVLSSWKACTSYIAELHTSVSVWPLVEKLGSRFPQQELTNGRRQACLVDISKYKLCMQSTRN